MLYVTIAIYLFFGVLSGLLLNRRGRPTWLGFLVGIFMGPLGPIYTLILPPRVRACPSCCKAAPLERSSCPHCGGVHGAGFKETWLDSRGMLLLAMLVYLLAGFAGIYIFLTMAN